RFFIRFFPETRKFVFVNYSDDLGLQKFHGKAVGLDVGDRHTPLPSLFIIHEVSARGSHPFAPVAPTAADDSAWQDWIMAGAVFDSETNSFKLERPRRSAATSLHNNYPSSK
ncbi:hypothetical protein BC826DRAFT_1117426, partial [Russula brevipes]